MPEFPVPAWDESLGEGLMTEPAEFDELLTDVRRFRAERLAADLDRAGWYDDTTQPYPLPTTDVNAPPPKQPPMVTPVRNLWMARFNPASPGWTYSDPDDDAQFPWGRPEHAVATGNYWLSSCDTANSSRAIHALQIGDLVIVQRSDPKKKGRPDLRGAHTDDVLIGAAIVWDFDEWDDVSSGKRERRVCLLPAAKFDYPIPRSTARRFQRLQGSCFSNLPQLPDGSGGVGFTLSAVTVDQWSELLAICGIHPDSMAEPDLAVLAAKLTATAKGNEPLWRYRWDHVFKHAIRVSHEQEAVRRCKLWAQSRKLLLHYDAQPDGGVGYDLVFVDARGTLVEVEIKGYMTGNLADVRLQPSQARQAKRSAAGLTNEWWLYAILKVHAAKPTEVVKSAAEVVDLIAKYGIKVR